MGLMGIHNLDVLHHFNRVTHCPWCGKVGQNEGTIINHLQTVHYKLGLVCEKCFDCLSIMSEAICHHGWKSCLPLGEGGPNESPSSTSLLAQAVLGQPFLNGNLDGGCRVGSDSPWVTLLQIVPALLV